MSQALKVVDVEAHRKLATDVYFSADVETDGPIPGPFSLLSFGLVYAGRFDGLSFEKPLSYRSNSFYRELKPISSSYQQEALAVNGLDRERLLVEGGQPEKVMTDAASWVEQISQGGRPVLVAYPLCFDWSWLYWYFVQYAKGGSPFSYSHCFDIKTAYAVKGGLPIVEAGRARLASNLRPTRNHTHHALDDAIEQAQIFAAVFEWGGDSRGRHYQA